MQAKLEFVKSYFAVFEDSATAECEILECDLAQDPMEVAKLRGKVLLSISPSMERAEEVLAVTRLRKRQVSGSDQ